MNSRQNPRAKRELYKHKEKREREREREKRSEIDKRKREEGRRKGRARTKSKTPESIPTAPFRRLDNEPKEQKPYKRKKSRRQYTFPQPLQYNFSTLHPVGKVLPAPTTVSRPAEAPVQHPAAEAAAAPRPPRSSRSCCSPLTCGASHACASGASCSGWSRGTGTGRRRCRR